MAKSRSVESLGRGYKPWLIATLVLLVGSLALLAIAVVAWFVQFGAAEIPIWVTILGVAALLGIFLAFGGMVLLFAVAATKSLRQERARKLAPAVNPAGGDGGEANTQPISTPSGPVE